MKAPDALRVVEFSTGIAAAYCGKLLADAGAEVTSVEPPGGHPLRYRRPAPGAGEGVLYRFLSDSKTILVGEAGDDRPANLVSEADVVIDDLAATAAEPALGRPGQVRVSFSPFGLDGPWRDRPWTEFTLQAMCGSTGKRGLPGRPPVYSGGSPVEFTAGSYGAAAASCYLWAGGGAHIDVSLLEAGAVTMHAFMTVDAAFREARVEPRRRTQIPSIEPTADGYIGFSTITAQQFTDFLHMIERPDMAVDETLLDPEKRQLRRDEIVTAIRAWTAVRTTAEILELATAFRIPVAPIGNGANLPSWDHMRERGVYRAGADGMLRPRRPYRITQRRTPVPSDPGSQAWSGGSTSQPLAGLRVADLSAFWAGPSATHLLAALGADVVKVESERRPDGMRYTSVRPSDERWLEWSPVFHGVNANKRSVLLDLRDPEDVAHLKTLIRWADVVIENFSPRVLDDFGLGSDVISRINPRAVLVRMPAFGLDGPWRDRTGFAMTVEQASGMAWQTGYRDGPPMDVGGVCDPLGGMHAVVALMAALRSRAGSGCGALVEVPLIEVALNVAAEQVLQHSTDSILLARESNHGPEGEPQGVYPAEGEDRWVAVSVRDDGDWRRLGQVLGEPPWATAAELGCRAGRLAHRHDIDQRLGEWTARYPAEDVAERLIGAGVPAAVVVTPADVAGNQQLRARGFFERLEHPVVGGYEVPSLPFRVRGRPVGWYRTPPPTVGQHSAQIHHEILDLPGER